MAIGDLVAEDYGFEFRGFAFGGSTSDFLVAPGGFGLADMPDLAVSDRPRLRRHGLHPGDDFMLGRGIMIPIEVTGATEATWESNLDLLKQAFSPTDGNEDALVFQVPGIAGGGKRRMWCRPRSLSVPQDIDWFYNIPIVNVRFEATSPFILDNTETSVISSLLTTPSTGLTWPLTWPLVWGTIESGTFKVNNAGRHNASFVARIPGPVTNPRIEHVGQSRSLEMTLVVDAGQYLEIDTAARTVLLNGSASRRANLTKSEWFDLTPGDNELAYRADDGTSNLTITYRSTWS